MDEWLNGETKAQRNNTLSEFLTYSVGILSLDDLKCCSNKINKLKDIGNRMMVTRGGTGNRGKTKKVKGI